MKRYILRVIICSLVLQLIYVQNEATPQQGKNANESQGTEQQKTKKHIIIKGDTWYSLAKKYHITYADLRLANKNTPEVLKIDEVISIPSPPDMKHDSARQEKNVILDNKSTDSTKKIHTVKSRENLSIIGRKYGVTTNQIIQWNQLSSKTVKVGQKLIVGMTEKKPPVKSDRQSTIAVAESSAEKKPDSVSKVIVLKTDTAVVNAKHKDSLPDKIPRTADELITDPKNEEIFAKGRKEITEEGTVAWIEDQEINPGKYFALHRTAPVGTIVKVTNRMNHRTVFVKVVGRLPDTGENENLLLKISKAAADKLGVLDARFQAQLNYGVTIQ